MNRRDSSPVRTKVDSGGRIVLPAKYRRVLGVGAGDEVVLVLREGEVRILTPRHALAKSRELLGPHVEGADPVADLLRERRREPRDG
jgi:AbrB family looped-hinge helix DNA binding protein